MPAGDYSDNFKAESLAALEANGGNILRTSREMDIPESTLRSWKNGSGTRALPADLRDQKKTELSEKLDILAIKLVDGMTAEKIAASGLFLEDSGDEGSRIATSTNMTNYAFIQCNKEVRDEIDSEINIIFPSEPLKTWTLGNYKYIVNAEIEISSEDGSSLFKKYACHIQYDEGSDQEGVMDSDNWTINGLSGIPGI